MNEASLESKSFHAIKCLPINLNYNPSNILENCWNFPTKLALIVNNQLEIFKAFYEIHVFYKNVFHKKMSLENPKTLRNVKKVSSFKCLRGMFLKTLIFNGAV